jgi:AraC-like DNA-binding protein
MGDISLDYQVPDEDLRPYVTLFYYFRTDVPRFQDRERADHAQLRFRLDGGAADYTMAGGGVQRVGPCHVIGPSSGALTVDATGPIELIGMGLQAAGWAALIGVDASAMLDRAFDSGQLLGESWCAGSIARLVAAPTMAEKFEVVAGIVRTMIGRAPSDAMEVARAIEAWLVASPAPAVEDLVAATGLSRRQVERRTKALYGVPPKLLSRKYRALRAAVTLAEGAPIGEALAIGGFYDQSHLNREIKQFAGLTPKQMHAAPGLLAQLTIGQRRALGGQVPPTISDT